MAERIGTLLLVSGPSGSGKTTLCRRAADEGKAMYSISCTTRAARAGEVNGRDYHFLQKLNFQRKRDAGDFLESAEVHGNFYGTLKDDVLECLSKGEDVVMDLDVQGAEQVRACADPVIQHALADLFVMPPTNEELLARLSGRGTDSEPVIALRMQNAMKEMEHWPRYRYRLLSGNREEDYAAFCALLIAERMRVK